MTGKRWVQNLTWGVQLAYGTIIHLLSTRISSQNDWAAEEGIKDKQERKLGKANYPGAEFNPSPKSHRDGEARSFT